MDFERAHPEKNSPAFKTAVTKCVRYRAALPIEEGAKVATLGVIKIGASITFNSGVNRTASNFDVVSTCRALAPNFRLHFITNKTRNTLLPKESAFSDIEYAANNINNLGLDALLVFNGSVNNWGGARNDTAILIWKCIQHFKGRVFYIHTDAMMRLHQIYDDTFVKRGWHLDYPKEDVYITRDDIVYLTQARNPNRIKELVSSNGAIRIKDENIIHFPLQEAILLRPPKFLAERNITWDLIYGGSHRSGRRLEKMVKYYFGHDDLKVLLFGGNLAKEKFRPFSGDLAFPTLQGPVSNSIFLAKYRTSLATVHITDDVYEGHWTALRFYESLIAGVIPFIDWNADRRRLLYYPGCEIADFLYVKDRKEVNDRINLIKRENCGNEILETARSNVLARWDRARYKDVLKGAILSRI